MYKFSFLLFTITLLLAASCEKKDDFVSFSSTGTLINGDNQEPITNTKVYRMQYTLPEGVSFERWDYVDSTYTDENGEFHFDFDANTSYRHGFYARIEHYFDYRQVAQPGSTKIREGFTLPLFPKAYLEVRVKDELPYSGIDTMQFSLTAFHPTEWLYGNPIDTTVITVMRPDETQAFLWNFPIDGIWYKDGDWVSCPAFDTCYYEITF